MQEGVAGTRASCTGSFYFTENCLKEVGPLGPTPKSTDGQVY